MRPLVVSAIDTNEGLSPGGTFSPPSPVPDYHLHTWFDLLDCDTRSSDSFYSTFTWSDLLSSSSDSVPCPVDTPFYDLDDDTGSVLKSSVDFFWMLPLLWF